MTKVPVLVTGGAGYIGSHAMLALKDSGWSVAVIDDLSNGARSAVPDDVPFYEGNVADRALVERILADSPGQVAAYKGGKQGLLGYFVGQVMKETQGKADPRVVNELVRTKLG